MLVGAVIMLPVLLYYTYYAYKIFGGKVNEKVEY
jgi:cytochrome bd-type quinol oxidase subunit 2